MTYDLLITNGTVVDGNGKPGFVADIAVKDGKIAGIGNLAGSPARRSIDATGRIVTPGFIDPHTHYDAQICWDPLLSPSSWHGITTMIIGNCGMGVAPCPPALRKMSLEDLCNVESIPMEVLEAGVKWEWESFPEFLDAADRLPKGVNVGVVAPLTPYRHAVLGEESTERAATPEETRKIAGMLKESVAAGGLGFSASKVPSHVGYKGQQLASFQTSNDEFRAYSHVLRELGRGVIVIAAAKVPGRLLDDEFDLINMLLDESGRPVTWMSVFARDDDPNAHREALQRAEPLWKKGARPQATPKPLVSNLDMKNPFLFSHFKCVAQVFSKGKEAQKRIYADPAFRTAFREESKKPSISHCNWDYYVVQEVHNPALKPLFRKSVAEIARQRGKDPFDVFFDLAIEDDLELRWEIVLLNGNEAGVAELVGDPRVMIGLSDGGAHLDQLCDSGYPTFLLEKWVKNRKVLTVERAIQRMTSEPADFFGFTSRGRLEVGKAADIVVIDMDRIESGPPVPRHDLPGGARRLVSEPKGIDWTIVNGQILYEAGKDSGARPGQLLRSGRS